MSILYFFFFVGKIVDGGIGDAMIGTFLFFIPGILVPTIYFTIKLIKRSYFKKKQRIDKSI
ncbi:MAG: hypothetical protein ACM3TR_08140 [Caulobacteraceae bacterium]